MKHFFYRLSFKFISLVLIITIPISGLMVYTSFKEKQRKFTELEKNIFRIARLISLQEEQLIAGTRELLRVFSQLPILFNWDSSKCSVIFADLLKQYNRYANFGVIKPNGDVFCSAVPMKESVNLSDRSYFQIAMKTGEFSIGDYQIGSITHKPTINFGYPIFDKTGKIQGVVFAALNIEWLSRVESEVQKELPKEATFTKTDPDGVVIAHYPNPKVWIGKQAPEIKLNKTILTQSQGTFEARDEEGILRVYAFTLTFNKIYKKNIRIIVGIPAEKVFMEINRNLQYNLVTLFLFALLAGISAWFGGDIFIIRRIKGLINLTKKLGKGDLDIHIDSDNGKDEIGKLYNAFYKMVDSLNKYDTERKKAEDELRSERERLETITQNIGAGVAIISKDYRTLWANKVLKQMFGDNIEGKQCYLTYNQRSSICPKCGVQEIFNTGKDKVLHEQVGKDIFGDTIWSEIIATPIRDNKGNIISALELVIPINERKRLEDEKQKIQAQLIQSQKMEAIGILAGGVAHDFNNLLTVIKGHSDLALMSLKEDDPIYHDLKEIHRASVRAANLTNQLLLFSRRQPVNFIPLNLNETVDGLLKMLKRLIGENIKIEIYLEPQIWMIKADPGNIEQIIMNIVVNARDAMPEGGIITIKTENVNIDEDYCKIYTYAKVGKFVCLFISDTGIGMDKETVQHIFEPFFTTKELGRGTGLGLSVVYGIVKQHGGWINVYSEPRQGSIFKIYLPAFLGEGEREAKDKVLLENFQGKGERILVVEDEEGVRKFTKKVLIENGYRVFEASNAEEALSIFKKECGNIDIIFSDVMLPNKSGLQLVEEIKSFKSDVKILLSSGYTDQRSHWPIIQQRGFRFIQKPYSLIELLRVIKEVIEQN